MSVLTLVNDTLHTAPALVVPLWQVLAFVALASLMLVMEGPWLGMTLVYLFLGYVIFIENGRALSLHAGPMLVTVFLFIMGGIGLGLALWEHLVEPHGGSLH